MSTKLRWLGPLVLSALGLFLSPDLVLAEQFVVPQDGSFHIEARPAFDFKATLTETWTAPYAGSGTLHVYAPVLPELPGQTSVSSRLSAAGKESLRGEPVIDTGSFLRHLLALRIKPETQLASGGIALRADYEGTLFARRLVRSASPVPIPDLTAEQRRQYLKMSVTMDHGDPALLQWVSHQSLRRHADEQTTQFAWRVFSYLASNGRDGGDIARYEARRPSRVFATLASDCGGLSLLFVAIMRANGIPARTLFGRWAIPQTTEYGQYHVIAEFFVPNSGWVPVDVSATVVHRPKDQSAWFGNTDGQFLTFHIDTDLEPASGFRHAWAQYLLLRWDGSGDFWKGHRVESRWSVTRSRETGVTGATRSPASSIGAKP
jgi:transglutaminase-like putative cysteine protease